MNTLVPCAVHSLPTDCCMSYKGMAFEGCFFYLTMPKSCTIQKLNKDFTPVGCVKVCRPYSTICYDSTENCFWASVNNSSQIFKLDHCLNEIDYIQINLCEEECSKIVGLSYNCENDTLLIVFSSFIAEVSKDGCVVRNLQTSCEGHYTAVLSIAPYYVTVHLCEHTQTISFFSNDGCLIKSFCFPIVYVIESILLDSCQKKDNKELAFIILATKHCRYPRLIQCEIDACDMELCCCNYEICCFPCDEEDEKDRCSCDLIESIALVEAALSHILNAEGEKLQRAVELSCNVSDLLEINRTVNKTLMNVTQLEHVLYSKLDTINSLCPRICAPDRVNEKKVTSES
ncbi:hypothetical protein [Clostridium sp. KNHs205]|jgi:hypothetical protein|uniref:hypothetical protein n=1 Tax=Clostridium sp. KNHs205 TaxID=1449050 RepID=UPI000AB6CB67|nr:hypothetical protein [Clostridium sp. KNHs205]